MYPNFCERLDNILTFFFRLMKKNPDLALIARRYVYNLPNDFLNVEKRWPGD